tara:strand:- start:2103 stop:3524 length:1422 start_codon:yes stop_codon:yes gene_type:complete
MFKINKENYFSFIFINIFTLLVFIIYSQTNILNFIIGKKYIFDEISYTFYCNNIDFYCRNIAYEFYKFIFSFFTKNPEVIYFFQLFLFSYSCFFLIQTIQIKDKSNLFKFLIFFVIFSNPKVFKNCFSLTEEALFISLITICLTLFIKIFERYNFKKLLILSILVGITYAIRPAGIFLIILPIIVFLNNFNLIKFKIILIFFLIFFPFQLNKIFFYKLNSVSQPSFVWGTILGKIPLFAENTNKDDNVHYEFQKILTNLNQKFNDDLNVLTSHTLRQYHRNSTIELYKTSKVAGEIEVINDYFKSSDLHSNQIIKETFFSLLKKNYLIFFRELAFNYLGIWELRELLNKEDHKKYNNLIKNRSINYYDNYNFILKSTQHPNLVVVFAKVFMLFFLIINLVILINYFKNYKKNNFKTYNFLFNLITIINFYFIIICISTNVQTRLILTIWPYISFTIIFFMLNKFFKIKLININ